MMEAIKALNDDEMEQAAGGMVCPTDDKLKELGLEKYVQNREWGWDDFYYDTWRGGKDWKHVGSGDMLKYVERTLGADNEKYQALYAYCYPEDQNNKSHSR